MLDNVKIGPKLIGGFLVVSIITLVIGILGINNMGKINLMLKEMYDRHLVGISHAKEANINLIYIGRALRNMILAESKEDRQAREKSIEKYDFNIRAELEATEKTLQTDEAKQLYKKVFDQYNDYYVSTKDFIGVINKQELLKVNQVIVDGLAQTRQIADETDRILTELALLKEARGKAMYEQSDKAYNSMKTLLLVCVAIAVIAGFLIGFFLSRSISVPLLSVVKMMQEMSKGHLDMRLKINREDEIGIMARSMEEMADKLRETISFALDSSGNVSAGSVQLSSASQTVSQGSSQQASSVEEISASLEEISSSIEEVSSSIEQMTASINQNADNANQTEKIAIKSSTDAKEGGEAVLKTVAAMKQIAEKISIIQEIARQTNLLSLNASIEAARAGEHGKGFAVVASAVQKLAERSQDAAEEINKLSKSSVDVAERAGEMLGKLVPDIQKTADLVAEINASSAEQNNGIKQVNSAVQQVNSSVQQVNSAIQQFNQVVQSNASSSEELASTSEELSSQAIELKTRLSFFQVGNNNENYKSETVHKKQTHQVNTYRPVSHAIPLTKNKENLMHSVKNTDQKSSVTIDMGDDEDNNFQKA